MSQKPYTILSVGGSIIIPKTGFDLEFLKKFRDLIFGQVREGQKFILVIGGGATCRTYQDAARAVATPTDEDLDWIGIKTTHLNAELVKNIFKSYAAESVVTNPTKKIKTTKPIIIAAGWQPGCSTDNDAMLLAKTYGAKALFNLSNIDYVYDSDPNNPPVGGPGAKKIEKIRWPDFRKIVGDKWIPGANVPFDPAAAKLAEKLEVTVGFIKGTDLTEVKKAITGGVFRGTVIS